MRNEQLTINNFDLLKKAIMIIKLNKDATIKEIKEVFRKISGKKRNPVNLDRYFDKVDFKVDGLIYQKKIRDEWK